jgi:integrase
MNTQTSDSLGTGGKKSANRLSPDGKWRSFPRVPHLLQYVSSGTYFARIKIKGKLIRESLGTVVWTDAQLKLVDFLKEKHTHGAKTDKPRVLFPEAVEMYKKRVQQDSAMKESSKGYRLLCIRKIQTSWPDLWNHPLDEITPEQCRDWSARLKTGIASQYFNNVVGTLRLIFGEGIKAQAKSGGEKIENPLAELSRAKIPAKALQLPEPSQFKDLVSHIKQSGSWGVRAADLVEFLAYSGTRLYTEAQWVNWEDIDWQRMEIVVRGNPETATKNWEIRRIPIISDMEVLLKRMQSERGGECKGKLLEIVECPLTLQKGCLAIGIAKLRHHDLRHLFATRCIESDVPIPTVARWLGHKDGGALAMRTYGHLRNEHSQAMAQKVKF